MIKRINNKGFVFVETIITTVILLTTLLLVYKTYSDIIIKEQKRLYYDDVAYIYKTIAIRDVFKKSYNKTQFEAAINNNKLCTSSGVGQNACKFIYFFNTGSPIFYDNYNMEQARELFDFYQLAYINISDIPIIKQCIRGESISNSTNRTRCNNMKNYINGYSYNNFMDYLNILDVDTDSGYSGILISIFFLKNNGDKITFSTQEVAFGKYEECIQNKVYEFYRTNYYASPSSLNAEQKETALKKYNENKDLNFGIQCSYAYYYSWVYL